MRILFYISIFLYSVFMVFIQNKVSYGDELYCKNKLLFDETYIKPGGISFLSQNGKYTIVEYEKENMKYCQIDDTLYEGIESISLTVCFKKVFRYKKKGKYYVVVDSNTYVSYDYLRDIKTDSAGSSYAYIYNIGGKGKDAYNVKGGKWWFVFDGKNYGPFQNIGNYAISDDGKQMAFTYLKNKKWFLKTSDTLMGPFERVGVEYIANDGVSLIYLYKEGSKNWVSINGQLYLCGSKFSSLQYDPANKVFGFEYIDTGGFKLNLSGTLNGPFSDIYDWYFDWYAYLKNNKCYISTKDTLFGPYEKVHVNRKTTKNRIGFAYKDADKRAYVYINGKVVGGYDEAFAPFYSEEGNQYGFVFKNGKKYYLSVNDSMYGPYDRWSGSYWEGIFHGGYSIEPVKFWGTHCFSYDYGLGQYVYVNVNNIIYGPFEWANNYGFTKEGKNVFTYTNNEGYFIQVNNIKHGPYDHLKTAVTMTRQKSFYYAVIDSGCLITYRID